MLRLRDFFRALFGRGKKRRIAKRLERQRAALRSLFMEPLEARQMLAIVAVESVQTSVAESATTPAFVDVSRSDCDWSQPLTVSFAWSGTAVKGDDFQSMHSEVTLAPYQASTRIAVVPINDQLVETSEQITVSILDSSEYTVDAEHGSVSLTLDDDDVNQAPSFMGGGSVTVNEDSGDTLIAGWATSISAGPANESNQAVAFHVTANNNLALFEVAPTISPDGTLTFRPASNAVGTATISVALQDDGGTNLNGNDTSPTYSFDISVAPVNDAPSFNFVSQPITPNVTADEDSGQSISYYFVQNASPAVDREL